MKGKLLFIVCYFILGTCLFADPRSFTDEERGYEVTADVTCVGVNMTQADVEYYATLLTDWSKQIGKYHKEIFELSKENEWGLQKALSKYNLKKGESYVVNIVSSKAIKENEFPIVAIFIIITNDNSEYEVKKIYANAIDLGKGEKRENGNMYSNQDLGYCGNVITTLLGENLSIEELQIAVDNIYDYAISTGYQPKTLVSITDEQKWLMEQGLSECNLKVGETYLIAVIDIPDSFPAYLSPVEILLTITSVDETTDRYNYNFFAFKNTLAQQKGF